MGLKSFLEPAVAKVAIALVLFALSTIFTPYFEAGSSMPCPPSGCGERLTKVIALPEALFYLAVTDTYIHARLPETFTGLLFSYLASCSLVFLLQKYHKQK